MNKIVASEKKVAFENLFNLYTYELALTGDPSLGTFINEDGKYIPPFGLDDYFNGTKEAYVLMEDNKAIGFIAFVNDDEKQEYLFEEAYLIFPYRNKGYMTSLLDEYLDGKKGKFKTHILKASKDSQRWFENYVYNRHLEFVRSERDVMAYNYECNL